MDNPRVPDRLMKHIHRSAETLAESERAMRQAHTMLAAAHRQIERSCALQRQIDELNRLHDPDRGWREKQDSPLR